MPLRNSLRKILPNTFVSTHRKAVDKLTPEKNVSQADIFDVYLLYVAVLITVTSPVFIYILYF